MTTQQTLNSILTIGGLALIGYVGFAVISSNLFRLQQYPAAVTPTPAGTATGGITPAVLGLKTTGKKVAMQKGAAHRNGQRFNVNHNFINYVMMGYFKPGNAQKVNMKTDGPNHGSCTSLPKCVWIEPQVVISSGKLEMGSEWPHPKNHSAPCPSCKTVGALSGEFGWAVAAFDSGGFRRCIAWIDKGATGKWTKVLDETDKGQITNATLAKRKLPIEGKGLEAEIRCHGGSSGTGMRDSFVWEITPPAGTVAATVASRYIEAYLGSGIADFFFASKPLRRYNHEYNV